MAEPPVQPLPADFGKYRLEKRLAAGGMAEIFLARRKDDPPAKPVVIKRILPHLCHDKEFVQMFLDEARIAGQLRHNNIVAIEDIGQVEGAYFLAMEYLHGEDIRRIYNQAYRLQRSLPLSHSIRVVADAALGLGYAHKLTDVSGRPLKMVHRDVSPQNILVTYEGDAKILDFGIAKTINKVANTKAGVLKGKYGYMSPEQALGEGVDHRTDIFALGIILYETTTGTRLFKQKGELATLQAIIKGDFVPPSEALQNYPPALEAILMKALAREKEARFGDADEFSAALYDFLYQSGLYVERDEIAEFMRGLFSDQAPNEVEPAPSTAVSPEDPHSESTGATDKAGDFKTTKEQDGPQRPEIATRAYGADARPERRKSTYVIRRAGRKGGAPGEPEPRLGSDQIPTLAVVPSFGGKAEALPSFGTMDSGVRDEYTERERDMVADPRPDRLDRRRANVVAGANHARRPAWIAGAVGLALLVATLTGILLVRSRSGRAVDETRPPRGKLVVDLARLTVLTEPGAEVFVQGELLGAADAAGQAGPYPLTPGEILVRVHHAGLGFERQRSLTVETDQNYQFEIIGRPGFLRVAVAPWARVRIDGRDMGLTPLPRVSLLEGLHELELINPDIRRRYQGVVRIVAGEEAVLKVNLQESGEGL